MPPTYKQTQGNDYSGVTLVHTIGYADINALAAAGTTAILVAGMIPAGAIVVGIYIKTTEAFVSATRPIVAGISFGFNNTVPPDSPLCNGITAVNTTTLNSLNAPYIGQSSYLLFKQTAQDIYIGFDWIGDANPKDYTAGEIKIYFEYKSFPTLS